MAKGYNRENCEIGELVRKAETDFTSGTTTHSKYVEVSLFEDINKVYAYLESKHTSGATDSQKREKPFFNIVLAARNIWFRATDIDRSNIKVRSTKAEDDIGAMLATIHLQDWMRRENFGTFLNMWGINSAGFNESVLKFVEKGGRLIPTVVPWNRIICDSIDFDNNPKIEILELTEAQLRSRKEYNQELVDKLCDALAARETVDKQKKDTKNNYIKLYEVHGNMPLSYLTGKATDADTYVQQMQTISFVAKKDDGKFDDFALYAGREAQDPYMLSALLPEVDGSVALRGAVKVLFQAQWMMNHTVKGIKDQLDLANKLVFQTSDPTFVGQNVLSAIQNGQILIHKVNEPLTQVANNSHDIAASQNFGAQWKQLGNELAGISESMLGITPPSGSAWRQTNAILQENHSLFEVMTENRGNDIIKMMRLFVLPFLKRKMKNSKQIAATLASHEITKIDAKYIKNYSIQQSNKAVRERILSGQKVNAQDQAAFTAAHAQDAKAALQDQGSQRFFAPSEIPNATWADLFKNLEWDVEVDVTGENVDKDAATTLNTLLQFFQAKQGQPMTPEEKFVVEKILRMSGTVSTLELASIPESPPVQPDQKNRVIESMAYKDAPEDIKRQIEAQAGLRPSTLTPPAAPTVPPGTPTPPVPAQ